MFEATQSPASYWEQRAARFATQDDGLPAVCSYGMPGFYNRSIQLCQRRALAPWLNRINDADVLELGCGVGRWTARLARNGNRVTGIDISPTMVAETGRRLAAENLAATLATSRIHDIGFEQEFDAALSVTVVQHIMEDSEFQVSLDRIFAALRPGGTFIMLEAAPSRIATRCDSPIFRARPLAAYTGSLEKSGFSVTTISGVDPMPFKTWLLPDLRSMPRFLGTAALALATAVSLPLDLLLSRRLVNLSWHKIIVATRPGDS